MSPQLKPEKILNRILQDIASEKLQNYVKKQQVMDIPRPSNHLK